MKITKLVASIALAGSVTLATTAQAGEVEKAMKSVESINPWMNCGIGAMLFNKPDMEIFALVSNVIWDLGTTAVSSAISSKGLCNQQQAMASVFVAERYAALEEEAAIGEGENLAAVFDIYGCSGEAQSVAINAVREELAAGIEAATTDEQRAEHLFNSVDAAAQACII